MSEVVHYAEFMTPNAVSVETCIDDRIVIYRYMDAAQFSAFWNCTLQKNERIVIQPTRYATPAWVEPENGARDADGRL